MAKKKAEPRKAGAAASSKAKSPVKGHSKPAAPQTPGAKSGGMRFAKKDDTRSIPPAPQIEELSTAILPESRAAPRHVVNSEIEDDVVLDPDVNAPSVGLAATDPRLPRIPTTLVRRNRHGVVQCECTVGPEGIFYNGRKFRSLSGAASAASKDLGLNPVVNGYVFFQLAKPARTRLNDVERLRRIGNRYEEQLGAMLMASAGEAPDVAVTDEIEAHTQRLRKILSVNAE